MDALYVCPTCIKWTKTTAISCIAVCCRCSSCPTPTANTR
ncbi:ORFL166C.iORF1 [Human betaherpesvirus 5]|nr:ORFL166C.iORF1 [Human betaherpesvirus 5]QHX40500.1 ORFL166C.iORF1 [Human betaherpesvirus 5]